MRLLLDQGIPAKAAPLLRMLGYVCHHVVEFGMQAAEDEEILEKAIREGYAVITLDADFHTLVAVRGLKAPSVIRLRREGCRAEQVVQIIRDVLQRNRAHLVKGCLISVKERSTKVRLLPIVPSP